MRNENLVDGDMMVNSYKQLIVWQKAMELTALIYSLTRLLPKEELYGIVTQMQRAAVSIPSNIAEGFHRWSRLEQARFMQIAYGSAAELETQLELCRRLTMLKKEQTAKADQLLDEVMRMLNALMQKLRSMPQ